MKKAILTSFLTILLGIIYGQQSFERLYQYWYSGEGNEVFTEVDGYTMAGFGKRDTTNYLFLLRTDMNGDTLWIRHTGFGHRFSNYPWIRTSIRDNNGNTYFAIGSTDSLNFVKFNAQWDLVWKKSLDQNFAIHKMVLTEENDILTVGRDTAGYCIRKLDTAGTTLWRSGDIWYNFFGSLIFSSILEMPDKKIVLISSWMNNAWYEYTPSVTTTYSSTGDSVSSVMFNPGGENYNIAETHLIGNDLLSICRGNQFSGPTSSLIKHRIDGTILMNQVLKAPGSFYRMVITNDNRMIACGGITKSNIEQIVLHSATLSGDSLWTSQIGYTTETWAYSMKLCSDNGLLLGGFSSLSDWPEGHPYLVRTDSLGRVSSLGFSESTSTALKVYPNPASEEVVFETQGISNGRIIIYDAAGRQCITGKVAVERTAIDIKNLAPGIYIYTVSDDEKLVTGKLVIKNGQ